jgi:hypothetical protein
MLVLILEVFAGLGPLPRYFLLRGQKKVPKEKASLRLHFLASHQPWECAKELALNAAPRSLKQLLHTTQSSALLPKFWWGAAGRQKA